MKPVLLWLLPAVLLLSGCVTTPESSSVTVPPSLPGRTVTTMDQTLGSYGQGREDRLILLTLASADHAHLTALAEPGEALPPRYAAFMTNLDTRFGLRRVADWPLPVLDIQCLVFESDGRWPRDDIIAALALEPLVESVQPMQLFSLQQQTYNDPYLHLQHGLKTLGADTSHRWASGAGVSVAVIDTGVDTEHPDLAAAVGAVRNFVDQDDAAFLADVHGTAVAGVIGATANNATGMVGIAPAARLMVLKACWQGGTPASGNAACNSYTLAKALNFAVANNADIINLSLAGPRDPLLERLVGQALDTGSVVVAARARDGENRFPASVPGTLAVGQLDQNDRRTLVAPGANVLSTHPQQAYRFFTGSSFATAHVAGLAALIRELRPAWRAAEIRALVNATADPVGGSANACRAIARMTDVDTTVCG